MKILLAVDTSAFAETAARAVIERFSTRGNEVRVLHAAEWEQHLPPPYFFAQGADAAKAVLAFREQHLREADEHVKGIAEQLRTAGFTVTTEVCPEGDPREAILDAAAKWAADLIVVGSHGRTGLDRFLLGSVSERVVRHAPCSVEVVRPKPVPAGRT